MKVLVNEKCIGCGSCVALTDSKIFDFNDEGLAYAKMEEVSGDDIDLAKQAIAYCPVSAIEKEDE